LLLSQVWDNTADCLSAVRAEGYQIVVTHLTRGSVPIQAIDWSKPTAFVLGNEKWGVSDEAVEAADHCAIIEMVGILLVCLLDASQNHLFIMLHASVLVGEGKTTTKGSLHA